MKFLKRKSIEIPGTVSGREVTNRGVHLLPAAYHGDWMKRADYWTDLLISMGISWVVIINDGDSIRQEYEVGMNPINLLLDHGIIPIIREGGTLFPRNFEDHETFDWTVETYADYGLKPFWIIRNEPFDHREWKNKEVPDNAWEIIMKVWAGAAQYIASNGGYVGFPDGPLYQFNPFESIRDYECQWIFDEGLGFYTGHHYGKNRPRDYPYDPITKHGIPLTEETYSQLLDDYEDDKHWREEPVSLINQRRAELKNDKLTAIDDDVCWRGWEKIVNWSVETFGYVVPMAMTEGGWVPRDRPGTGPNTDIRMPHTTPKMVGKKTLAMFDAPSPFFAICPWLLADDAMVLGGYVGWPFDSWVGWAYANKYGPEKPVKEVLSENEHQDIAVRERVCVQDINSDIMPYEWLQNKYGISVSRGDGARLVDMFEYAGEDYGCVTLYDETGLPVEGANFIITGESENSCLEVVTTGKDGKATFKPTGRAMCITPPSGDTMENFAIFSGGWQVRGIWILDRGDDEN